MTANQIKTLTKLFFCLAIMIFFISCQDEKRFKLTTYIIPENSGEIVFYDPRPAPVFSHPSSTKPISLNAMVNSINPAEGGLVLFPSYLDHSVNENLSN